MDFLNVNMYKDVINVAVFLFYSNSIVIVFVSFYYCQLCVRLGKIFYRNLCIKWNHMNEIIYYLRINLSH